MHSTLDTFDPFLLLDSVTLRTVAQLHLSIAMSVVVGVFVSEKYPFFFFCIVFDFVVMFHGINSIVRIVLN